MITEKDMVDATAQRLRSANARVALEVPFMCQSIDMVYEDRLEKLVAIEFKRHDWNRALEQCRTHLLGADQVYICLLRRDPPAVLQAELAKSGIGLLLFDASTPGGVIVHTQARDTACSLQFPASWLRQAFEQRLAQGDR